MDEVIRTFHCATNYLGVRKTVRSLNRRFAFSPPLRLGEAVKADRRKCLTCQDCDPPNWEGDLPIEHTPVPPHLMSSVAIDIFSLPPTQWKGKSYDSLLLCVDRLSGWMIARPCTGTGLSGEEAAHLLMDGGWEVFGIPAVITSDQGPQFVGQWWKTMCARLGVRVAYSQAYRPQANGRAEVAGQTIIKALRKVHTQDKICWPEALPRVLWAYHNAPGEAGLSPFQIMFGRDRFEGGIPMEPPYECESAKLFFDKMEKIDEMVSNRLMQIHKEHEKVYNAKHSKKPPFLVEDRV